MTVETTYDWENIATKIHEYPCSLWTTSYTNTLMGQKTVASNDPEHRAKPDEEDLIWNMTPQSRQSTYEWRRAYIMGISERPTQRCRVSWGWYRWPYNLRTAQTGVVTNPILSRGDVSFQSDWATKLRLKIKDETINLGTAVAEYRQSARMFGSAARAVVNAYKTLRGKRGRKTLTPCSISSAHLVYTYGIAPLVSDLYDSVEALKLRLEHPVFRKYFISATGSATGSTSSTPGAFSTSETNARLTVTQRVNAYVKFDLEKAALFTLGNPLEIAWELVPYSFVIDWMVPIGDYLMSLDALKAVENMSVSVTEKETYNHKEVLSFVSPIESFTGGNLGTYKSSSHERFVYDSVPLPALPKYDPSTSFKAVANGLALLWQSFGQRKGYCKPMRRPRYRLP